MSIQNSDPEDTLPATSEPASKVTKARKPSVARGKKKPADLPLFEKSYEESDNKPRVKQSCTEADDATSPVSAQEAEPADPSRTPNGDNAEKNVQAAFLTEDPKSLESGSAHTGIATEKPGAGSWCLLINRSNLLTILGSGMITGASDAWRYVPDSRDAFDNGIPLWRGAVPEQIFPLLENTGAEDPVLLEFGDEIERWLPRGADTFRLVPVPLPFSKVVRVRFKDLKTLEDFRLKQFDDIPDLPEGMVDYGFGELPCGAPVSAVGPAATNLQFGVLEKLIGALLAMSDAMQDRPAVHSFYSELAEILCQRIDSSSSTTQLLTVRNLTTAGVQIGNTQADDIFLLNTTLDYLSRTNPDLGFDTLTFVTDIEKKAQSVTTGEGGKEGGVDLSGIARWCDYCRRLLNGSEELKPLTDAKSVVQRGILLFLLRPDQERFRKVMSSSIQPGPKVYVLAALLLGYYVGLARLNSLTKGAGTRFFAFVEHFLEVAVFGGGHRISWQQTRSTQRAEERGRLVATHDGFPMGEWDVVLSDTLLQIFHQARRIGLSCQFDFMADELVCQIGKDDVSIVRIRILPQGPYGDVVRIYGKCSDQPQLLDGATALSLLEKNGLGSMHGKFALVESGTKLIYAQDQLVDTMDKDELKAHVQHVADVVARLKIA